MKENRHNPEQIIRKLREAGRLKAAGKTVAEICRAANRDILAVSDENPVRQGKPGWGGFMT